MAAGAFAVYFGIHAIGLQTAANRLMAAMADTAAMSERTEALLLVPFSVLTSIWIGIFGLRLLSGRSPFRAPADGITVA